MTQRLVFKEGRTLAQAQLRRKPAFGCIHSGAFCRTL